MKKEWRQKDLCLLPPRAAREWNAWRAIVPAIPSQTDCFLLYSKCFIVERQLPLALHVVANCSTITTITGHCGVDHQDG